MDNQTAYKLDDLLFKDIPTPAPCEDMFHEYFGTKRLWVEKIGRRVGVTLTTLKLAALTAIMKKGANVMIFVDSDRRDNDQLLYNMLNKDHPYLDVSILKARRSIYFERSQSTIRFVNYKTTDLRAATMGIGSIYGFGPSDMFGPLLGSQKTMNSVPPAVAGMFPQLKKLVIVNDVTMMNPKLDVTRRFNLTEMGFNVIDTVNLEWLQRQQAQGTRVI